MTAKKETTEAPKDEQMEILKAISEGVVNLGEEVRSQGAELKSLAERVNRIETNGRDDFKKGAKTADIEAAAENRKGIDQKIVTIVDEILGTDFGIQMTAQGDDQLGYMFTLLVPERMNDNPVEKRPLTDADGIYKRDPQGNVLMENWQRPDRRSKVLATADGYGAIREHCEKVRAYMVSYYASQNKQMPTLKVK